MGRKRPPLLTREHLGYDSVVALTSGGRTSVLTQVTDPAVPARGWSGHRDQNIDVPGDDSGCFHV